MKQYEAVIQTIENLGGIATLGQLNQETFKIKDCEWKTKTSFASIRRIVQTTKEIYKIKPGLYGLVKYKKDIEAKGIFIETEKNKTSKDIIEFNHSYYQGLILIIGNLRGFDTFIPNQDKNKKFINKKSLYELKTLTELPKFSYNHFIQRSSTIDVIWFNERKMPFSFFEVEHSTNIQNSLLKFNDLQDFNSRMYIVADSHRQQEYGTKIKYSSFKDINKRIEFLSYESLIKQYEQLTELQNHSTLII